MATNTYKPPKQPSKLDKRRQRVNFFRFVESSLSLGGVFEQGLPIRYIPHILFLTFIGIIYIGNIHYAEKNIRKVNRLKREVDDLRADYTTIKAEYMLQSKQSEVANKVAKQGLVESSVPPYKVVQEKKDEE
ncbi:MAG: FtsL-like putative cell division protein [Cytophagales bacterium]|jgi:hypothetical protein|nr:FtsL-like putative cell division protein [Cytophagales bacterium]